MHANPTSRLSGVQPGGTAAAPPPTVRGEGGFRKPYGPIPNFGQIVGQIDEHDAQIRQQQAAENEAFLDSLRQRNSFLFDNVLAMREAASPPPEPTNPHSTFLDQPWKPSEPGPPRPEPPPPIDYFAAQQPSMSPLARTVVVEAVPLVTAILQDASVLRDRYTRARGGGEKAGMIADTFAAATSGVAGLASFGRHYLAKNTANALRNRFFGSGQEQPE
jgi:hypothetical protein